MECQPIVTIGGPKQLGNNGQELRPWRISVRQASVREQELLNTEAEEYMALGAVPR
jgi:hypothetical protein